MNNAANCTCSIIFSISCHLFLNWISILGAISDIQWSICTLNVPINLRPPKTRDVAQRSDVRK